MKIDMSTLRAVREALPLLWAELDKFTKRHLAWSVALMILVAVLTALVPVAMKLLVDSFAQRMPSKPNPFLTPMVLIGAFVLSNYLSRSVGELRTWAYATATQRVRMRLSARLFRHILKLPLSSHLERGSGSVSHVLAQGLSGYQTLLQHVLFTFLPVVIELAAVTMVLVQLKYASYLAIFAISALLYLAAFIHGAEQIAEPARAANSSYVEAHALLTDSLLNYETVKYFTSEDEVSRRYEEALGRSENHLVGLNLARMYNGQLTALIFGLSLGVTIVCAGYQVLADTMTVGGFLLMYTYATRLLQPIETAGTAVRDLSQATAGFEKMLQILRESPEADRIEYAASAEVRGELRFENVNFSYSGQAQPILQDVSFDVWSGQTVAIVGLSGSGKSTLIRLMFHLFSLNSGRILLDGVPIAQLPLKQLRRSIGVVPQDTVLFNRSIGENIGVGRPGCEQAEIEDAAKLAQLHDFIMSMPQGYATKVGERGVKLSGGQRQRVSIARAALKRARILVFDEATSSLDSRTEAEILRNMHSLARASTTLVIAHRLSTVAHADQIVVLSDGVIVERGTHTELLARNAHYATMWREQHTAKPGTQQTAAA